MKGTFDRLSGAINEASVSLDDITQSLNKFHDVIVCDSGKWEYKVKTRWEKESEAEVKTLQPAICSCCGGRIGKENYCEYCGTRYW